MVAWALSCSVNRELVLWIRKDKIETHSTKSSTQGLISNLQLHVLFEVKTEGDSGFMNDRIALSFVCTRVNSSLIRLHSSVLVSHLSLTRLYSFALVSQSSSLIFTRLHSYLIRLHSTCYSSVILLGVKNFMMPCSFVTMKSIESIVSIYPGTRSFSNNILKIKTTCIHNFIEKKNFVTLWPDRKKNFMTFCPFLIIKSIEFVISI